MEEWRKEKVDTTYKSTEELLTAKKWYLIDATDMPVGRMASQVASILRGKGHPYYSTHQDCGDHVIIINAKNVKITGNKANVKTYFHHTFRPGSVRYEKYEQMMNQHPERILEYAIHGMMPKTALGRQMESKLQVYADANHPHEAQNPQPLTLKY
jgi:large subunit ribosomal protein L13